MPGLEAHYPRVLRISGERESVYVGVLWSGIEIETRRGRCETKN